MKPVSTHLWSMLLALVLPALAMAHPGHGPEGGNHSAAHYLTEPVHIAMIAAVLLVLVPLMVWAVRRSLRKLLENRGSKSEPLAP